MVTAILLAAVSVLTAPLHAQSPEEVTAFLEGIRAEHRHFADRLSVIADAVLGTPYEDGPLGEGPGAPFDDDPLIDFSRVDCVTFVEQAIALAEAATYEETVERLQRIRYAGGRIAFEHRNHFMLADWVENNAFVEEVTADLGVAVEPVTRAVGRTKFFGLHGADTFAAAAEDESRTVRIVPTAQTATAEAAIPSPSLICFVGKVDWLFALHCGLYIRGEDGRGRLYHASSQAGEVVAVDLTEYMAQQASRYIGFTVHRIDEPTR